MTLKILIDERIATHLQPLHDKLREGEDIAKEARDQTEFLEKKLSRIDKDYEVLRSKVSVHEKKVDRH